MPPPHAVMVGVKLKKDRGRGSGSLLTRAFACSKLLLAPRLYLPLRVLQG